MGRLFNKNTVKLSYSCTRNVKSILAAHNKKILAEKEKVRERGRRRQSAIVEVGQERAQLVGFVSGRRLYMRPL